MDAVTGPIEVWYRPGTASPYYESSYKNALQKTITGQGKGNVTSLPAFAIPIVIPAGSTYTLYVTAAVSEVFRLWRDVGQQLHQVYASDKYLEIKEGYASGYPLAGDVSPRRWNGKSQL